MSRLPIIGKTGHIIPYDLRADYFGLTVRERRELANEPPTLEEQDRASYFMPSNATRGEVYAQASYSKRRRFYGE